jgi:hypothetical protein
VPYGTRAPKELLHHLPAWYCAGLLCPHRHRGGGQRVRGSRLLDRRPPHYRCPAVPGLKASARAILMAPGSSVLPSVINHLPSGDCVLLVMRTAQWPAIALLFGSQPRRPSCVCSGSEHHCRTSRCARPQPTPSPRCCSLTSLLGTANCTYGYCHCGTAHGGPSSLRATRSGRQSRRRPAATLASELHHRTVLRTATACTAAWQFVSARPCCLSGLREKP